MSTNTSQRPHIVHIHVESMDGRLFGAAGNRSLRNATPEIDSIAERGVRFTNAYSNCPVCNPSRASMFTGQYPSYYDNWNNHEGLKPDIPTLFDVLAAGGYHTEAIGPLDYAYGMHSIRDRIGSWTRAAGIMRPTVRTPMPVVSAADDFFKKDRAWTDEAVKAIYDIAGSTDPSYVYLTTGLVHPAFQAHPWHMAAVDDAAIEIPPTLSSIDETSHPAVRYIRATKHCENRFDEALVHEIRHVYAAMVVALDELVGRVLKAVRTAGIADRTWIIFSSDHGEMAGEQNQVLKRTMFEPSIHIPLVICGPGVERGKLLESPVSLVDLYPTILDLAGITLDRIEGRLPEEIASLPDAPAGESLVPQLTGNEGRKRSWAFAEYHGDRCPTGTFMLRKDNWKYIRYEGYPSQLFDVDADPWEANDIAEMNPEIVAGLDTLLMKHVECEKIDARAKQYDRDSFLAWREHARETNTYEQTMARVYSGFDGLAIEDVRPWGKADEERITEWLAEA